MADLLRLRFNIDQNNSVIQQLGMNDFHRLYSPYLERIRDLYREENSNEEVELSQETIRQDLDTLLTQDARLLEDQDLLNYVRLKNGEFEEGYDSEDDDDDSGSEDALSEATQTRLLSIFEDTDQLKTKYPFIAGKYNQTPQDQAAMKDEMIARQLEEFKSAMSEAKMANLHKEKHIDAMAELLNVYHNVVDKNPALKDDFALIYSVNKNFLASDQFSEGCATRINAIPKDNPQSLQLVVRNLENTGLTFSVDSKQSLILTDGNTLTPQQSEALAKFMYNHCDLHNIDDINIPEDKPVKVVGRDEKGQEVNQDFRENFKQNLLNRLQSEVKEDWTEEQFQQWVRENELQPFENEYPGPPYDKASEMKLNLSAFKSKVIDRLEIMGFTDRRLIQSRRCADGSIIITAYTTEDDMKDDAVVSKGRQKHKKAFSVKLKYKNGIPVTSWYLPHGKPLEGNHVRVMLEALKSQGCNHVYMPNAMATSGKGQGAFWEACAKALVCPMCYPDGAKLDAGNVNDILEALKKEIKFDTDESLQFKHNLLKQLKKQENAQHNAAAKEGKSYKTASSLSTQMEHLEGSIIYDKFNASGMGKLLDFIDDKSNKDISGNAQLDQVETLAAYKAVGLLVSNYEMIKRTKYNNNEPTDKQLQGELAILMRDGIVDKNGRKILGTLSTAQDFIDTTMVDISGLSAQKKLESAVNKLKTSVKDELTIVFSKVESDYGVKLSHDSLRAVSKAAVPTVNKEEGINKDKYNRKTIGSVLGRMIPPKIPNQQNTR